MTYAIMGAGKIGTALARIFARQNIEVALANSRGAASLAPLAQELGSSVQARSAQQAQSADVLFLAVPFAAHAAVAAQLPDWSGKIVVDMTNAFQGTPDGRLSSEVVAAAFAGAHLVKAFNHLPASQLGTRAGQAIFVASNELRSQRDGSRTGFSARFRGRGAGPARPRRRAAAHCGRQARRTGFSKPGQARLIT